MGLRCVRAGRARRVMELRPSFFCGGSDASASHPGRRTVVLRPPAAASSSAGSMTVRSSVRAWVSSGEQARGLRAPPPIPEGSGRRRCTSRASRGARLRSSGAEGRAETLRARPPRPLRNGCLLRNERKITAADLRRAVSSIYGEIDTHNLQFHLYKMQSARVLSVAREGGRDVVTLERDVVVRARSV